MPAVKQQPSRQPVDLTRKTPWGTKYRVVRAETADLEPGEGAPWATICLEHSTYVTSPTLGKACLAGTRGSVAEWCDACKPLSVAGKPAPESKPQPEPEPAPQQPAPRSSSRRRVVSSATAAAKA